MILFVDKDDQTSGFLRLTSVSFARTSPNPMDRRMDIAAYFLSLMSVLDMEGETHENIREISLMIASDYVKPKNKFQAFIKRFPVLLIRSRIGKLLICYLEKKLRIADIPMGSSPG